MNFYDESPRFAEETVSAESDLPSTACRPQLLVSVRDIAEFGLALELGVDVIDLKEPRRGALSPTDPQLWKQVAREWSGRVDRNSSCQLSAALGEAAEARSSAEFLPAEFHFAKAGPSQCPTEESLLRLWADVRNRLDPAVDLVAVAYADHEEADCPPPEQVLRAAAALGMRRCLLDTYTKDGRSSIERLGLAQLRRFNEAARQMNMWWVLAGSIGVESVESLATHEIVPNCFGVRGDVCEASREGSLRPDRVERWITELNAGSPS